MEKTDLIFENICDEMARVDRCLTSLMGELHDYWSRIKDSEQKVLAAAALDRLCSDIIPALDTLVSELEEARKGNG